MRLFGGLLCSTRIAVSSLEIPRSVALITLVTMHTLLMLLFFNKLVEHGLSAILVVLKHPSRNAPGVKDTIC
jgi:hypothetical protein